MERPVKKQSGETQPWLLAAGAIALFFFRIFRGARLWWTDFTGQWLFTAYTLRQTDPYTQIGNAHPADLSLGAIPRDFGTSPWGCLLGNLFYPGYLSLETAKIYFVILYFVLLGIVCVLWTRSVPMKAVRRAVWLFPLAVCSMDLLFALQNGNAGGMICCLLMIGILIADAHPIMAGACLAFAMVKPQLALLICFIFFLQKRWSSIVVAITIVLGAWGVVSALTKTMPWELLFEFLSTNIGGGGQFSGIFTMLFPENARLAMLGSMCAGVAYVFLLWLWKYRWWSAQEQFLPAILACAFWCYAWENDHFILLCGSVMLLHLAMQEEAALWRTIGWLFSAYVYFGLYIRFALKIVLYRMPHPDWMAMTIYAVGLVLTGFYYLWRRDKGGGKKGLTQGATSGYNAREVGGAAAGAVYSKNTSNYSEPTPRFATQI